MFALRLFFLLSGIILNTGCGFRPLYLNGSFNDYSTIPDLNILRIPERNGQIIRNRLQQLLSTHINKNADTILEISPIIVETKSTSVRRDGTTSRYRLTASTTIKLINSISKKVIYENNAMTINAYSIGEFSASAAYSTLTAAQDAKDKALLELADQIISIVVSYYQNPIQST